MTKQKLSEIELLRKHLKRLKCRDLKRRKYGYKTLRSTGTLGEFFLLQFLQGSELVRQRNFDIRYQGKRYECKTSRYLTYPQWSGWQYRMKARQKRYSTFTAFVCLSAEKELERIYIIPSKLIKSDTNVYIGPNCKRFSEFRVV